MLDMSSIPVGIWADWLEEQGEDTSLLRAMIDIEFRTEGIDFHLFGGFPENGDGFNTIYGIGHGYFYGDGTHYGYKLNENGCGIGDGYGDDLAFGNGTGYENH